MRAEMALTSAPNSHGSSFACAAGIPSAPSSPAMDPTRTIRRTSTSCTRCCAGSATRILWRMLWRILWRMLRRMRRIESQTQTTQTTQSRRLGRRPRTVRTIARVPVRARSMSRRRTPTPAPQSTVGTPARNRRRGPRGLIARRRQSETAPVRTRAEIPVRMTSRPTPRLWRWPRANARLPRVNWRTRRRAPLRTPRASRRNSPIWRERRRRRRRRCSGRGRRPAAPRAKPRRRRRNRSG
mmetsp:Transcript_3281/g.14652  ORF Transcript_3281/g.14652 Transcript_3281/m.14652 type:complete len:240 (-) Transcript_3281:2252-2971(-)